ncbi:MAG TPA: T9SS type A sorting domain-containing protein [Flavobacteriales bacterium]|nr:T9SS type A sorting domain-containing protein [Flavobacteriales bacterium]
MKYFKHLLLSVFFIPGFGYSQISLTLSDMVSVDTTIYWAKDYGLDSSISPGNPGVNTWDFSLLYNRVFDSLQFVNPSTTPYAGSFSAANLCVKNADGYEYYTKNTAGFYLNGVASDYFNNGIFLSVRVQPSLTLIGLPANYLNSSNETAFLNETVSGSSVNVSSYDSIFLTGTIQVQTVFDAYGTMISPLGTVDVLRQKVVETVDYTLVGKKYLLNAVLYSNQLVNETETTNRYIWWTDSPRVGFPLIEMELDANGDAKRIEFAVPFNAKLQLPIETKCFDSCDAVAAIINPIPYYNYLWSDPGSQTSQTASGLCKGNYFTRVSDSIGAFVNIPFSVLNNSQLTGTIRISGVSCLECSDGEMQVEVLDGTPPYAFQWDSAAGGSNSASVGGLEIGSYSVTIVDSNGCSIVVSSEMVLFEGVKVFPNPTYDYLNITTRITDEAKFRIYDLSGRRVAEYELSSSSSSIYVGGLGEGIYSYHIISTPDGTEKRGKFCVLDF